MHENDILKYFWNVHFFVTQTPSSIWWRKSISSLAYIPWTGGFSVKSDTKAVVIVTPAEGPSLLIAPSGKWMCTSRLSIRLASRSMPNCNDSNENSLMWFVNVYLWSNIHVQFWILYLFGIWSNPREGYSCRLFHYVTQLTSQDKFSLSNHFGGLHNHNFTSDWGPGQADGNSNLS